MKKVMIYALRKLYLKHKTLSAFSTLRNYSVGFQTCYCEDITGAVIFLSIVDIQINIKQPFEKAIFLNWVIKNIKLPIIFVTYPTFLFAKNIAKLYTNVKKTRQEGFKN